MSRQRDKGTNFERAVVALLANKEHPDRERWERRLAKIAPSGFHRWTHRATFPLAHRTGSAAQDEADIAGTDPLVIECKDQKAQRINDWIDQATAAAERANEGDLPCLIHKRPGRSEVESLVTMPLWAFLTLLNKGRE